MFTEQDLLQIEQRGSALDTVKQQIANFEQGFPFMDIVRAATINDGIIRLDEETLDRLVASYDERLPSLKVVKFVPASGAASRMFKALFAAMSKYQVDPASAHDLAQEKGPVDEFFQRIADFAFYHDLAATFAEGELAQLLEAKAYGKILSHVLTGEGLDYGQLPKGLLKFHAYGDNARTPAEEHMVEAANYASANGGTAFLHFTVSPEHQAKFTETINATKEAYESAYGVQIEVSYSVQKPATDTVAVDMDNQPFRLDDGHLLFRPAGHGALIENLNDIEADLIFVKNIDNVVPDRIKDATYTYKKALASMLLDVQQQIFNYEEELANDASAALVDEVAAFIESVLCVEPEAGFADLDHEGKKAYVWDKLHRPIRVCGMVKNEGEPGGGPFWATNEDGTVSLQIVESAQIDKANEEQMAIMKGATHFNPVDLVCATRDKDGKSYDCLNFRDLRTGFISQKSKEGRELKAQELPGLWNGAMANWNTLFVEVPIVTFNPVKTVNDLLRPNHQPG
ncbi:MAG: DUF4301 family protein [Bacteroidota bacterium]